MSLQKYIQEQNGDKSYFHVSPRSNRKQILNDGLKILHSKRYKNISDIGIYVWKYKEIGLWYALTESRDFNEAFDIYKIKNVAGVLKDNKIGIPHAYIINNDVLPINITLIDTIFPNDNRLNEYGDIGEVLELIDEKYFDI